MEKDIFKYTVIFIIVAVIFGVVIKYMYKESSSKDAEQNIKVEETKDAEVGQEQPVEQLVDSTELSEDKGTTQEGDSSVMLDNNNKETDLANNKELSIEILDDAYDLNKRNVMFSPISLNMALGMVSEGAKEDTKEAIDKFLGTQNYSEFSKQYLTGSIKEFNVNVPEDSYLSGYNTALEIANSVWIDEALDINDTFKDKVVTCYQAQVENVDFGDAEGTSSKVNTWCKEKTHDMIPSIISPDSITPDTQSILANSVYFESAWLEPWTLGDETETFTLLDESTKDIQFIHNSSDYYYESEYAKAFSIPYINGLEFIGILPNNTGEFTLSELDISSLLENKQSDNVYVDIKMPKLNFDTEMELTSILSNKGLGIAFGDSADFTNITKSGEKLKIGSVLQKTKIELDENGTKAAAVTAMLMENCAMIVEEEPPKEVIIHLNRPFAYIIYDRANDQILFIGKVIEAE